MIKMCAGAARRFFEADVSTRNVLGPVSWDRRCFMLLAMLAAMSASGVLFAGELGQWTFADGQQGWTPTGQATVSDIARRPGVKSLRLVITNDTEQDSAWLSPELKSDGKPVRVRFWAADNYVKQPDYSYSAAVGLAGIGADGKAAPPQTWEQIPWDDGRLEQWWGPLTPAGLLWKHYEVALSPPAKTFRVIFFWPKAIVRGECYLSDLSVVEADPAQAAATPAVPAAQAAATLVYSLEITTPSYGNLFYADDPLRFEFLLFDPSGKELEKLSKPELSYDITDYEKFSVASGKIAFDKAAPCEVGKGDKKRMRNLRQSVVLSDLAAKAPGREFFLHAVLRDGDRLIAEDTVTYGVVDRRIREPVPVVIPGRGLVTRSAEAGQGGFGIAAPR